MMSAQTLNFTHGVNKKPASTGALEQALQTVEGLTGECFFGFPLIATPDGKYSVDCTFVSPEKGIVLFDLVEGTQVGDFETRQDDLVNKIEARLKLHRELVKGRALKVPLNAVTFAPAAHNPQGTEGYPLANDHTLATVLTDIEWEEADENLYRLTLSAIESLSSIRKSRSKREITKPHSRGAKLKSLEDSVATLDHRQSRAVIETVDGVQRIRGLAGSGKTIILALKAAYLHTQYPEWRIAVTFHTRSLKGQFRRLINNFCLEQSGEEPDPMRIRVVNAWGAPGGEDRDGLYYEFCRATGQDFHDFNSASRHFGGSDRAFDGACQAAISAVSTPPELYDAILIDEAQDLAPSFLRLCYAMLRDPKRLVYAYDELQNLSGESVPPPEEIFGTDSEGQPLVTLNDPRRDVILQKCYRNSRPVLVTAHALGFGIYRPPQKTNELGLVQMFDQSALWEEIGYRVEHGQLAKGQSVVLARTAQTSPKFLEDHSPSNDLVSFEYFKSEDAQNKWLVEQIKKNIEEDELKHEDIIVIHPDPISARGRLGPIRKQLYELGIQNHLAGVDTVADVFFRTETSSITFTGIYRAKGNEAGMVYVINAQDCDGSGLGLSSLRNRLFTAITRSKAWVRVAGTGPKMKNLILEFDRLRAKEFKLDFVYPNDDQLSKLRVVHRDLSPHEKQRLERKIVQASDLADALETGELNPEDLDENTRKKLLKLLGAGK